MISPRITYWDNLRTIKNATGQLDRRMSFKEAAEWIFAYDSEYERGYDMQTAAQRAYDCMFASRNKGWLYEY
jgi:hypothetical protein